MLIGILAENYRQMASATDRTGRPGVRAAIFMAVVGGWVLGSTYLIGSRVAAPARATQLHLLNGLVIVVISGTVVYLVGRDGETRLRETTTELRSTLQQTHVLHRVLRHTLRNTGNVIVGNAERIEATDESDAATTIRRKAEELLDVSEQSRILREVSLGEHSTTDVDISATVASVVAELEDRYLESDIDVDRPPTATVTAHPDVDHAVREVIVNAIEHGDGRVTVRVTRREDGDVTVAVTDEGPGFPEMERTVLEEGFLETQTRHSQGLGLWIVRSLLNASNGSLSIDSEPDEETTVRLTFTGTVEGAIRQFLR